jgi:hypothetical protein
VGEAMSVLNWISDNVEVIALLVSLISIVFTIIFSRLQVKHNKINTKIFIIQNIPIAVNCLSLDEHYSKEILEETNMPVSNTTKALKDIMRIDAGINGDAQYIEQITWMLFLKAFDHKEEEWEYTEDDYYPVLPIKYR